MELDINPLLADEQGVLALDARFKVAPGAHAGAASFAITPYPAELARQVQWNGELIDVRPIRPEDEPQHRAFVEQLQPSDLRLRFFSVRREMPQSEWARLTQIDYAREMAFIAVRTLPGGDPQTLGVVRAVCDPDNIEAEYAIIVRSDLKGQGLGQLLMQRILEHLQARGTQRVTAYVLRENSAMLDLARALGFRVERERSEGDTLFISLPLAAAQRTEHRETT
jgi:acetyltransferase